MNTRFKKTGIGRAENSEGSVVRGYDKEMLIFEKSSFSLPFAIEFSKSEVAIYLQRGIDDVPRGYTSDEVSSEIQAGVEVVTGRRVRVRWT